MSKGTNWSRSKALGKPTLPATVIWTRDDMGQRAKRAFAAWSRRLTRQQRKELSASPR